MCYTKTRMRLNQKAWEREYAKPILVTKSRKPQRDFLKFLQWVKKNKHLDLYGGLKGLDLGCGVGRNAYYLARVYGVEVYAWDFSENAIRIAEKHFTHPLVHYELRSIAEKPYPLPDGSIDLALDIMASHALTRKERERYLEELARVLKPGGYVYVRTFAREGDRNAQNLLKKFPGKEEGTYLHPELGMQERIFTGPELKELYGKYFRVVRMVRKSAYQKFQNQPYKRQYWNLYLTKCK